MLSAFQPYFYIFKRPKIEEMGSLLVKARVNYGKNHPTTAMQIFEPDVTPPGFPRSLPLDNTCFQLSNHIFTFSKEPKLKSLYQRL